MGVLQKRLLNPLRHFTEWSLGFMQATPHKKGRIYSKRQTPLSPEKQAQLDRLCEQLLQKQELITSGKLQLIGLANIKKRLGKRWKGLSKIVYETAEDVINRHLDSKDDFYVRYKDDVYFLLFVKSSTEEGKQKAASIAEEIQRRLFELDEKKLRELEVRQSTGTLRHTYLQDCDLYEFLEALSQEDYRYPLIDDELPRKGQAPELSCIQVGASDYRPASSIEPEDPDGAALHYSYLPLWDVKRGALTTYLCLARDKKRPANAFEAHRALYDGMAAETCIALDIRILKKVTAQLVAMQKSDKRFLIACPVQYETLHHFESYELYKQALQLIPEELRGFLIIYVMDIERRLPVDDAYWFIKPIKEYCRHCFAELPLRSDLNFRYMRNLEVDAVGFRIGDADISRVETLQMISRFSFRAKGVHIPMTFLFELSQISTETCSIFTEYDYVGGEAIHKEVSRPDRMLRFRSEDLLMRLIRQEHA